MHNSYVPCCIIWVLYVKKWREKSGWWITMLGSGLLLSWRWVGMSAFHSGLSEMERKLGLRSSSTNIYNKDDVCAPVIWSEPLSFPASLKTWPNVSSRKRKVKFLTKLSIDLFFILVGSSQHVRSVPCKFGIENTPSAFRDMSLLSAFSGSAVQRNTLIFYRMW